MTRLTEEQVVAALREMDGLIPAVAANFIECRTAERDQARAEEREAILQLVRDYRMRGGSDVRELIESIRARKP